MAEEKAATVMTESIEKTGVSSQKIEDVHVVKKVHADGHVDLVDAHAIGGALEEMPKGYFWSLQFIGTVIVRPPQALHTLCETSSSGCDRN